MQDVDLRQLPTPGPVTPYQVYWLPELNAVMAFGPLDRGFMPGKITFILDTDTPLQDVKDVWTCRAAWSDSRWGGELDLMIGDASHRHRGYEETLALVRAQAIKDAEPRPEPEDDDESGGMKAYLDGIHARLLVPALLPGAVPVWMVKTADHGGQGGNLRGEIHVTCGDQVFPGWFQEEDEPYDCTVYGIGRNAAAQLPAGTAFGADGTWEHVNPEYAYLFE